MQRGEQLFLMGKRLLVAEQHLAVGNGNHVVVEHALVDHIRVLLGENHLGRIDLVQAGNGLAGCQRLTRRITGWRGVAPLFAPVNKQLQTRLAIIAPQAVMVGRAFVAKHRHLRQGLMHLEMGVLVENGAQHALGGFRFGGAVKLVIQVRYRQVDFAIQRIG